MTGALILNGTTRHVAIINGSLATHGGRLIVATTDEEKAVLPGTVVTLPPEWVSVTEWVGEDMVKKLARKEPAQ